MKSEYFFCMHLDRKSNQGVFSQIYENDNFCAMK